MIDQFEKTQTTQEEGERTIRGYVLSGREMLNATSNVQDYLNRKDAPDVFTDDERLYADIALGLIEERAEVLTGAGEKGPMGPAFSSAYEHLRGIVKEEKASATPDSTTIQRARQAHAAGGVAAAKLDVLLAAARGGTSLDEAVDYIQSPGFATTEAEAGAGQWLDALPEDTRNALALDAFRAIFGDGVIKK